MEVFQAVFFSSEWTSESKFPVSRIVGFFQYSEAARTVVVLFTISMLQIKYDHF